MTTQAITSTHYDAVIVGLGDTGLSCAQFLHAQGQKIAITDTRLEPPALPVVQQDLAEVPLHLGGIDADLLQTAKQLILSPGVSCQLSSIQAAARHGVDVIGDIELFAQHVRETPIVAITGSNGKSTVTSLVAEMFRAAGQRVAVGGNLGPPALTLLTAATVPDIYVLELSSFQLETTLSLNARVATVLNISADHMTRYKDLAAYTCAKKRIYRGDGSMVINRDDLALNQFQKVGRKSCGFTLGVPDSDDFGCRLIGQTNYLCKGEHTLMAASDLAILGTHNIANALAALALIDSYGLDISIAVKVLQQFRGLPHRCQWVAKYHGVDWYDDSKGTNVGACCAAIASLVSGKNLILIAGGDGKASDFTPLARVAASHVKAALLIGVDGPAIAAVLAPVCPVHAANSMQDAVAHAAMLADAGDVVLLSPACASFDMFKDYIERGHIFSSAVHAQGAQQ